MLQNIWAFLTYDPGPLACFLVLAFSLGVLYGLGTASRTIFRRANSDVPLGYGQETFFLFTAKYFSEHYSLRTESPKNNAQVQRAVSGLNEIIARHKHGDVLATHVPELCPTCIAQTALRRMNHL